MQYTILTIHHRWLGPHLSPCTQINHVCESHPYLQYCFYYNYHHTPATLRSPELSIKPMERLCSSSLHQHWSLYLLYRLKNCHVFFNHPITSKKKESCRPGKWNNTTMSARLFNGPIYFMSMHMLLCKR